MSRRTLVLVVGSLIAVCVLLGIVAYGLYRLVDTWIPRPPGALATPRVVRGEGVFDRSVFVEDKRLGLVSEIRQWPPRAHETLVLAGRFAAAVAGHDGRVRRVVSYGRGGLDNVAVVDIDQDGQPELLRRGSWSEPVVLMNNDGSVRWQYPRAGEAHQGVDDAAAGDLDGDGVLEVVVGFNGDGGVHLLDAQGRRRWRRDDGNVWQVAIADLDADGAREILHTNAMGQLTARTLSGDVAWHCTPGGYAGSFDLVRGAGRPPMILTTMEGSLVLTASRCATHQILVAPELDRLGEPRGVGLRVRGLGVCTAIVAGYQSWNRSLLAVYRDDGRPLYREILSEECLGLAAVAVGDSEELLVGCASRVWRYSPRVVSSTP